MMAVEETIAIAGTGRLADAIERRLDQAGVASTRLAVGVGEDVHLDSSQLERATVLVLAADDDTGNVELALQARRLYPSLPLVVRLFDTSLASYLTDTMKGVSVLSMSIVSAPVFADAARRFLLERSCTKTSTAPVTRSRRPGLRIDRVLIAALLCLFLVVFTSAILFSHALNLRYLDALYFVWTTVMTVGYGDISLKDAPDGIKLFGMALMLAGAAFIAVLFALLSDWVVGRRLDVLRGRTRVRDHGHVLIAGAGNLGLRVAELLAGCDRSIVVIERDADGRNAAVLSASGHHVIIADATREDILELAGFQRAGVLVAVTDSEAANLQIALHARRYAVPVVMRLMSPELSAHVTGRGDWVGVTPVAAAAEAFTQAALARVDAARRG